MVEAFRAGEADYVHLQGPAPQQLEKDGAGHIVASVGKAFGPVAFSSLCSTRSWLASDMAPAFMRAYRKAQAWVLETPAREVARVEGPYFEGIDADVLEHTIAFYQQLGNWTRPGGDPARRLRGDPRRVRPQRPDHQASSLRGGGRRATRIVTGTPSPLQLLHAFPRAAGVMVCSTVKPSSSGWPR